MSTQNHQLVGLGSVQALIAIPSEKESNMELLSSRGGPSEADQQRTGQGLTRQPGRDTWSREEFSLRQSGKQHELVRLGTQTGEELTRKQEDRGRELLGVMEDHPCERAMNSEKETAKTMTAVF